MILALVQTTVIVSLNRSPRSSCVGNPRRLAMRFSPWAWLLL